MLFTRSSSVTEKELALPARKAATEGKLNEPVSLVKLLL